MEPVSYKTSHGLIINLKGDNPFPNLISHAPVEFTSNIPAPEPRLFNTLNCNRLALKCLKIRGNQLCETLMMMAAGSLLKWFDRQLNNPIKTVENASIRTATIFECIHYQQNAEDHSFTCFLSYDKPDPRQVFAVVSLNRFLITDRWVEPVLHRAIPGEYLAEIKSNNEVYQCLVKEAANLIRCDSRFKRLRQTNLPAAIGIDDKILDIVACIYENGHATSEDLTLIWRNIDVYNQLIRERNPLLKFFHAINLHRLKKTKKSLKYEGDDVGRVPGQETTRFNFHEFRKWILEYGFSKSVWRYLNHYGDQLFEHLWRLEDCAEDRYCTAINYLWLIYRFALPAPPSPFILDALLNMKGFEPGNSLSYLLATGELNTDSIKMALHYYGQKSVITRDDIDDLLMVVYWETDYGIDLDNNQKRLGWTWLVNKCRQCQKELAKQIVREKRRWTPYIGDVFFHGVYIREIVDHHALFCAATLMRNCLQNYVNACMDEEKRVFTIQDRPNDPIIANFVLNREGNSWLFDDIRGFANTSVTQELRNIADQFKDYYEQHFSTDIAPNQKLQQDYNIHRTEQYLMPIKVGPYFELIAVKSAIDERYPGGSQALVSKLGNGQITNDFIVWGTIGMDPILCEVKEELKKVGLNCNPDDVNCAYIETCLCQMPKEKRSWITAKKDGNGDVWLFPM